MVKTIDIVIPTYRGNIIEFESGFEKQYNFYKKNLKYYKWNVLISVNGFGADKIIGLSKNFCEKYPNVSYIYTPDEGKGYSVINGLLKSKSNIVAYMDVDLSTNLSSFMNLINQINEGYDLSTGSRYHKDSNVKRYFIRRILSVVYHLLILKYFLGVNFKDSQCGYKAVNQKFIREILPLIKDRNWFFETEMMYFADKKGFKIKEIPIIWRESGFSSVNLIKVVFEFLFKIVELKFRKII